TDRVHRPRAGSLEDVAERRRRGARTRHVVGDPGPGAQRSLAPLRPRRPGAPSRFAWSLLAIVAVAFGIRVSYVAIAKAGPCRAYDAAGKVVATSPSKCLQGDELFYNSEANFV